MNRTKRMLLGVGALLVLLIGGTALAAAAAPDLRAGSDVGAGESDDAGEHDDDASEHDDDASDTAITGDPLAKASTAALAHTGGGRVTETEVDDEESYYEVEVRLDDGRQVDVQLDRAFNVVGADDEDGAR